MPILADAFNQELLKSIPILESEIVELHTKMVLTFVEVATIRVPVDTGHLRANTRVSINRANSREYQRIVAPSDVLQRAKKELETLKLGDTVIVQNNADYASYVNDGTDRMAPRPFWTSTIDEINLLFP